MPEAAVRLSGVTKRYRLYSGVAERALDVLGLGALRFGKPARYADHPALDGVDLEIAPGERLGIVGRNGAGKTTLLKLIAGNFAPTSGEVRVAGRVQALMTVGLGFHPEFTGRENVHSALIYNGLPEDAIEDTAAEVAAFAELGDYLDQPMRTYSQGMQARLMFAAATAVRPDILIVDEVLGAGDAYFSAKSARRMRELAESGCTLLLVSHAMQQVLQFCDEAIWLERGRIATRGRATEVVNAYEVDAQRRITAGAGAELRQRDWLAAAIDAHDAPGDAERPLAVTLEDGRTAHRWPGASGVKIRRIGFVGGADREAWTSGEPLAVEAELEAETDGPLRCRYYLSVFDLNGQRVAWITSPVDGFEARRGLRRRVEVRLDPLLLGAGRYILSASVFDDTDPRRIDFAVRYDLLARFLEFRVVERDGRNPALFHHPGSWSFGEARRHDTGKGGPACAA